MEVPVPAEEPLPPSEFPESSSKDLNQLQPPQDRPQCADGDKWRKVAVRPRATARGDRLLTPPANVRVFTPLAESIRISSCSKNSSFFGSVNWVFVEIRSSFLG